MDVNEYQRLGQRTANLSLPFKDRLLAAVLGLGEGGEVQNLIKKWLAHGHPLSADEVIDELGDMAWYVQEIAALMGVDLETVLTRNIEKLQKRYPEGFSEFRSLNRMR